MPSIASLIVRIGANDQEIQNALASIGQKAKSLDVDLKKLGGSPLAGQAQKSLENLRATMTQVTAAQERVADRARLAAQGLEAMGGASRLTDSQLKQVNRTLQEGLSAYSALGKEPPAALKRIATETKNAMATTDGWKASLKSLGTALGAVFTVGMFVNFGRDLLRMGDDIVRVADRTGLLTDEVQQLSYISAQSGNSIDELVGAIGQMQNRLTSGDKSAVRAVERLNLSFEELRKAGPYKQLELIAEAVGKIENPALRSQYAMDLFGRSGIAILPTLTAKFKELGDAAPKMSEDTVRALDQAGDALGRFQLQVKVWAAESYNSARLFFDGMLAFGYRFRAEFTDLLASTIETASNFTRTLSNALKGTVAGAGVNLLPDLAGPASELRQSAQFYRDLADGMAQATDNTTKAVGRAIPAFADLSNKTDAAAKAQERWNELVAAASGHTKGFSYQLDLLHFQLSQMAEIESLLRPNLAVPHLGITPTVFGTGKNVMAGMGRGPADLPTQTFDASIDRLEAMKAALGEFKAEWMDLGKVVGNIAKGFLRNIGSMLSGGVLTLVGKGIEALWGGIKNLFNIASEEETKVSPLREEFFKLQGGLESLNPRVLMLTGNLKAVQDVFDARTVDEYNAAIGRLNDILAEGQRKFDELQGAIATVGSKITDITVISPDLQEALDRAFSATSPGDLLQSLKDINDEIDEQQGKFKDIDDTLKEYGLKWTDVGNKAFKQDKVNTNAKDLRKDFDVLRDSGIDVNAQMRAMGKNVRDFIKDAQDAGVEVPESMRQVIQTAIDAGEVFDKDGKKITDITQLGLTFGTTMETVQTQIADAMSRLVIVLEGLAKFLKIDLPGAAETGADKVQGALDGIEPPDLTVRVDYDTSGFPRSGGYVPPDGASTGALVKAWGLQYLQMGGFARGTDTVPAMLTPGEMVLTKVQQGNVDAALSSPSVVVHLTMNIDGILSDTDLVQTVQRKVLPIIERTIEDNTNSARTRLQDVLGVP